MSQSNGHSGDGGAWVVIPYKGPVGSKRRLAPLLDEGQRAQLSATLFEGVLDAVLGAALVRRVLVIQPPDVTIPRYDAARLEFVQERAGAARDLGEDGADGLNLALGDAQRIAMERGAESLLMLPSDLPMIDVTDVEALILAAGGSDVVVAPDRASEGTNALLLRPPRSLTPAFGVGSFERHQRRAQAAGLLVSVVRRPGLALDLDTPADVLRLYALAPECRVARALQQMGVTDQLIAGLGQSDMIPTRA